MNLREGIDFRLKQQPDGTWQADLLVGTRWLKVAQTNERQAAMRAIETVDEWYDRQLQSLSETTHRLTEDVQAMLKFGVNVIERMDSIAAKLTARKDDG